MFTTFIQLIQILHHKSLYLYHLLHVSGGRGASGGRRSSFGARNGPSRGGGYHDRGARSEEITYEIDPQMREYYAHMAVQQM